MRFLLETLGTSLPGGIMWVETDETAKASLSTCGQREPGTEPATLQPTDDPLSKISMHGNCSMVRMVVIVNTIELGNY